MSISAERLGSRLTEAMRSGAAGDGDRDVVSRLWPALLRDPGSGELVRVTVDPAAGSPRSARPPATGAVRRRP